jgi:hypothetical protein
VSLDKLDNWKSKENIHFREYFHRIHQRESNLNDIGIQIKSKEKNKENMRKSLKNIKDSYYLSMEYINLYWYQQNILLDKKANKYLHIQRNLNNIINKN